MPRPTVRVSIPLPETTWRGLRRLAEQRRVRGRASLTVLIAELLAGEVDKLDEKGAAH